MPTVPRNEKCSTLGCNNPRSRFSSLCVEHGGRDQQKTYTSQERRDFNAMYQTRQWATLRAIELSRSPMCASCLSQGIVAPATEVDHVFPWKQIGKEAFYRNIFQCLCHDCHSSKTQNERRGIFSHWVRGEHHERVLSDWERFCGERN